MNPGELNRRIVIQRNAVTTDDSANIIETWSTYATVWAAKRGLSGREYYAASAVQAETDVVYTIRYSATAAGITAGMQIVDGATYNIKSVIDKDGRREWLEIRATKIQAGG